LEEADRVGARRRSRRDMGGSTGLKRKEDNDVGVRRSEEASDIGAQWRSGPRPGVGGGGGLRQKEEAGSVRTDCLEEAGGIGAQRRPGPGTGGSASGGAWRRCVAVRQLVAVVCEISGVSELGCA
jgi:hypothetical protein